jgi:hypothetical protein
MVMDYRHVQAQCTLLVDQVEHPSRKTCRDTLVCIAGAGLIIIKLKRVAFYGLCDKLHA